MSRWRATALAALAAVALLAAACSSSSSPSAHHPGPGGASSAPSATSPTRPSATGSSGQTLHVVSLNLLHGLDCPKKTDNCRAPARVKIFANLVSHDGCPPLIGLQEIGQRIGQLVTHAVTTLCHGSYRIAWKKTAENPSHVMILSRLPILDRAYVDLANFPWEGYWVRVKSPGGPVDFLTAHFASNYVNPSCNAKNCPSDCPHGISTNHCHAHQVVDFMRHHAKKGDLRIATGDLNSHPGSKTLRTLAAGGFRSAWKVAGTAPCNSSDESGCTSDSGTPPFVGTNTKAGPHFDQRLDYILAKPGSGCDLDLGKAAVFVDGPAPRPIHGMYWPSDHRGVQATLRCG
jgi:endonuclease/exonuclease/phosphatase family metal-dependent hydrolase